MNEYFEYKTSRWVRIYLILMHLFAAACSYAVMTAYGFVLFLFLGGIFCHVRRKRKRRIVALQYDRSKIWLLKTPNDEWIKAHLLPSSVLFRHVMILHFCEVRLKDNLLRKAQLTRQSMSIFEINYPSRSPKDENSIITYKPPARS